VASGKHRTRKCRKSRRGEEKKERKIHFTASLRISIKLALNLFVAILRFVRKLPEISARNDNDNDKRTKGNKNKALSFKSPLRVLRL